MTLARLTARVSASFRRRQEPIGAITPPIRGKRSSQVAGRFGQRQMGSGSVAQGMLGHLRKH
jgi:hypothetical protein